MYSKENGDFRVQRTYHSLVQAMEALLCKKDFDDITVVELCKNASIRPATFYTHFSDKFDFFKFMLHFNWQSYQADHPAKVEDDSAISYYKSRIINGFLFLEENRHLFSALSSNSSSLIMAQSVADELSLDLKNQLEQDIGLLEDFPVEPEIIAQALVGLLIQCSRWWLFSRHDMSRQTFIQQISQIVDKLF